MLGAGTGVGPQHAYFKTVGSAVWNWELAGKPDTVNLFIVAGGGGGGRDYTTHSSQGSGAQGLILVTWIGYPIPY